MRCWLVSLSGVVIGSSCGEQTVLDDGPIRSFHQRQVAGVARPPRCARWDGDTTHMQSYLSVGRRRHGSHRVRIQRRHTQGACSEGDHEVPGGIHGRHASAWLSDHQRRGSATLGRPFLPNFGGVGAQELAPRGRRRLWSRCQCPQWCSSRLRQA